MADISDFLSTPDNYATANQVASTREYAKALLGIGKNDMNQPINHWTQGLSNMVHALVGGHELYNAGKEEQLRKATGAADIPARAEGATPAAYTPPMAARPPAYSGAPEDNPDIVPTPVQTQSITNPFPGGVPMPQPRPDGAPQDFNGRWPDPKDTMTPYSMPGQGQASALPFDAETSAAANAGAPAPNAPSAIAMALRGGASKPPFGAPPTQAPPETYVDPRTLPSRPQITRQQLERLMANDYVDPKVKEMALQQYYQQFQPMETETTGGKVIVDPRTGTQRFVAPVNNRKIKGPEGMEIERPDVLVPVPGKPGMLMRRTIGTEGAAAAPPAAGMGSPSAAPAAPGAGPMVPSLTPGKSNYAPDEDTGVPTSSAGPIAGIPGLPNEIKFGQSQMPAGAAPEDAPPGMLSLAPPGSPTPTVPGASGATPGVQTAQAGGIDPEMKEMADFAQQRTLATKRAEEYNKKDIDDFSKSYEQLSLGGQRAAQSLPNLELAKNMIKDPRFYSGPGGEGLVLPWKQLQAQFGKDPSAAAPMEVFRKVISGQLIDDMKITLQGLGQVRVAEIDLLSKAAGSLGTSKAANEAVLELMMRAHKQVDVLSNVANDYRQGWRFDKDGKAVMTNESPTKAGLDAVMKRFVNANPLVTKEERSNYEHLFEIQNQDPNAQRKAAQFRSTFDSTARAPSGATGSAEPPPGFR